ncbi:MAG: hypothetical protein Q4B58_06395, partial [Bacteroidales bacterium]|nr:hypothetical protein [Bacteroidales bacterium]
GTVYGNWHPSGRYGVFSTNKIIPAFHSDPAKRLEVYDTRSDLCVADFETGETITSPLVTLTQAELETFPCFSADGNYIYYCSAPNPCDTIPSASDMQPHIGQLHYNLKRIGFEASSGTFGSNIETIVDAEGALSVNFPRCSPDGRWLSYVKSSNGTFPIWHMESRIMLQDIDNPSSPIDSTLVHATYHSWSHNSKWIAFASKQYDTQYSRIYLIHVDAEGHFSEPLCLPQADPSHDDMNLRSYNIPDLAPMPVPFGHDDVKRLMEN